MYDLFIDGAGHTVGAHAQTWADLLSEIDAHLERQGRMVTAVRFDGIDLPTFREPPVTAQPLTAIERIDLDTASPRALLGDSLRDGASACAQFRDTASDLAVRFRQGELATAGQTLATLANDLLAFVYFVGLVRQWIGDDERLRVDGNPPDEQIALVSGWVESLIAAHASADWLTVADILEYDLEPFLRAWCDLLIALAPAD